MAQFGIGQSVRRVEDRRFLTGNGRYLADIDLPCQLDAYFLRSPHAHARILKIDATAARAAPGVEFIGFGADLRADGIGTLPCDTHLPNSDGMPMKAPARHALAADRVRHGGAAQGIGQALLEQTVYDNESGQLLTGSLMDYCLPRASHLPSFDIGFRNVPCRTNPLGIKGAGEAGAVGAPPAIINAIVDALAEWGVVHIDMPATPERVWRAIAGAK